MAVVVVVVVRLGYRYRSLLLLVVSARVCVVLGCCYVCLSFCGGGIGKYFFKKNKNLYMYMRIVYVCVCVK